MKKKGFTLVELLAVIVILAVVALIAVPLVTKLVADARQSSLKASISNYNSALEREIEVGKLKDTVKVEGKYTIIGNSYTKDDVTQKIEIKGTLPEKGNVCINNKGIITQYSYVIEKTVISKLIDSKQTVEKGTEPLSIVCDVQSETVEIEVSPTTWASSKIAKLKANTVGATLQYRIEFSSDSSKNVDWTNIKSGEEITIEGLATEEQPAYIYGRLTDGEKTSAEAKYKETKIYDKEKGFASVAKLGDYVQMRPTSTYYSVPSNITGCTGYRTNSSGWALDCATTQTINPSELDIWRIISINSDGTLELVSHYVSSKVVNFHAKTGYNNLAGGLNEIAKQYKNDKYTIGYRHIGYHGQTEYLSSMCSSTSGCSETQGGGDTYHTYDTDSTSGLVYKALGTLVATNESGTKVSYWLPSRKYGYTSCYGNWFIRYIGTDGNIGESDIAKNKSSCTTEFARGHAIRPIIKVKAGLEISSGNGSSIENAWVLN